MKRIDLSINKSIGTFKFTITASKGALVIANEPDQDNPTSSSGDNIYELVVRATDKAGKTSNQALTIKVTDDD